MKKIHSSKLRIKQTNSDLILVIWFFFFFSIEHGQLTVSNKIIRTRLRVRSNAFRISTTFRTIINLPQRRKSNSSMYSWGEEIWRQKSWRNLYFAASWIITRHVLCLINYKLFYDDITNVLIHRYRLVGDIHTNVTRQTNFQHNDVIQFSISVSTCPFCARARELLLLIIA